MRVTTWPNHIAMQIPLKMLQHMPGSPCLPCGKTHEVCDSGKMEPPNDTRSYSPLKAFTAYKRRTLIDLACLQCASQGLHQGSACDFLDHCGPAHQDSTPQFNSSFNCNFIFIDNSSLTFKEAFRLRFNVQLDIHTKFQRPTASTSIRQSPF